MKIIPEKIIKCPEVTGCIVARNLQQSPEEIGFGDSVHKEFESFLRNLKTPAPVILYVRGYGDGPTGIAKVVLENVFWDSQPYPRLDFDHPAALDEINSCPNLWGTFVLAIAPLRSLKGKPHVCVDPDGTIFQYVVSQQGIQRR